MTLYSLRKKIQEEIEGCQESLDMMIGSSDYMKGQKQGFIESRKLVEDEMRKVEFRLAQLKKEKILGIPKVVELAKFCNDSRIVELVLLLGEKEKEGQS